MTTKESVCNILFTLSLIALCLPLFVKDRVKAENACPYETYLRVDDRCLDVSQPGLDTIVAKINTDSYNPNKPVNREIEQVGQELQKLSGKLDRLCGEDRFQTLETKTIKDVCQY